MLSKMKGAIRMSKNFSVNISEKKVMKKLEAIARKKYQSEQRDTDAQYAYSDQSPFRSLNGNILYGKLETPTLPNCRKIKCPYCNKPITIPLGYSHCPNCRNTVSADISTEFLI